MGRITDCFDKLSAEGRTGLVPYLTVGYPTLAETPDLVAAAVAGGACMVELGVPFSDPLADGATIQRAGAAALNQGVHLSDSLLVTKALRAKGVTVPLLFMGYYNTFLSFGLPAFCQQAKEAGADGVICVDLPPEEAEPFLSAAASQGLNLIFLLAPTSTDERLRRVAEVAQGFIYCVSLAGVTGARTQLREGLPDFIARVREHTKLPLAVGFGISTPEHVAAVGELVETAVVGSALIDVIDKSAPGERPEAVQAFVATLAGATPAKA